MLKMFLIAGGGSFLGGGCRLLLSKFIQDHVENSFPFGTMAVNLIGCLIIGLLYGLFERGNLMDNNLRIFLTVGFCGGFTTFSTFANENFQLIADGNIMKFAIYVAASIALGITAVGIGYYIIKSISL